MRVGDVMTQEVISAGPEESVAEVASKMLKESVSGLPVIDTDHKLIGIVTEGDLLRRTELGTQKQRPRWLEFLIGPTSAANDYIRSYGRTVSHVMSRDVAVATEDMPLHEAVALMERRHVKRLPVVRDGRAVGMLTRANLVRALVVNPPQLQSEAKDDAIRAELERKLSGQIWRPRQRQITVKDGIVDIWGYVTQESHRDAVLVAADNTEGVRKVRDHMVWFNPYFGAVLDVGSEAPVTRAQPPTEGNS